MYVYYLLVVHLGALMATDLGRVSSFYYLTHQSMAVFNEYLKPTMSEIELFRVFSLSTEFQYMSVREEEKVELASLLDKVRVCCSALFFFHCVCAF